MYEKFVGRNVFSIFGAVPEYTAIREGQLRAQGPFRHPILTGTFAATLMPLFVVIIKKNKTLASVGIIGAAAVIFACASSGPLIAGMCVVIGFACWPFHKHMRAFVLTVLVGLLGLHLVMQAPVWALIGRVSSLVGGTGWHRVELIDAAIKYFNEWWLLGTNYTAHWGITTLFINPNMADITNNYINEGIIGGVWTMILFVLIIALCFRKLGQAIKNKHLHEKISAFFSLGSRHVLVCACYVFFLGSLLRSDGSVLVSSAKQHINACELR